MTTDNQQLLRLAHILKISTVIFFQLILISSPLRACQKVPLLPPELQEVPFAEDAHIVQNSKILNIKGVSCAFNASIAQKDDGYIIVFREDIKPLNSTRIEIRTGYAYFDKNFQQEKNLPLNKFCHFNFQNCSDRDMACCCKDKAVQI